MKRIVICADGTWNQRDQIDKKTGKRRPSNVTKVARAVNPRAADGVDQVVYYHDGIGTSGGWLDRHTDGAFGHGMEEHILNLYRFIVYNFVPGDELYFFGFSRGAFTVRSLAGFLHRIGLLEKDDDYYSPDLYGLYERSVAEDSADWVHAHRNIAGKRDCPPIHFIGVWDTVGALGPPGLLGQALNRKKYSFHDTALNGNIHNAAHALAIDERRRPFAPVLWKRPTNWEGKLQQAWFPGVHTNIGGGYDPDGLANEALHWIVEKAEALGLEFDRGFLAHYAPHYESDLQDSMTVIYKLMKEYVRPIGQCAGDGECLHQSALDRHVDPKCQYAPPNLNACFASGLAPLPKADTKRVARHRPQ